MTRKQVTRVCLTGLMLRTSRTPVHALNVEAIGDLGKGTVKKEAKKRQKGMQKPVGKTG